MNRYTIYCTEEQTRKALELGASITINYHLPIDDGHFMWLSEDTNNSKNCRIPTAEQMCGWLEEQGIIVEMVKCDTHWFARSYSGENTYFNKGRFVSRKEATLAAIDAALEYLSNNK